MPEFAQEDQGKRQSLNTSRSQDSAAGLFRTSIFVTFMPSLLQSWEILRASLCLGRTGDTEAEGPFGQLYMVVSRFESRSDPTSTLFHTAFWQLVVSCPLEMAIFCCLSKALLKALFPREHLHICKKRERGPQELCAGYFKIILIYYPVTLEWLFFIYPRGLH